METLLIMSSPLLLEKVTFHNEVVSFSDLENILTYIFLTKKKIAARLRVRSILFNIGFTFFYLILYKGGRQKTLMLNLELSSLKSSLKVFQLRIFLSMSSSPFEMH